MVRFTHSGFQPLEEYIDIIEGQTTTLSVTLTPVE
jgi:hypothetical protein